MQQDYSFECCFLHLLLTIMFKTLMMMVASWSETETEMAWPGSGPLSRDVHADVN